MFKSPEPTGKIHKTAAIVRNPYDRLVSNYTCRIALRKYRHYTTFDAFLDLLPKFDKNTRPMHKHLPDEIDFLLKFETIEEDWQRFAKWTGEDLPPLLHKNRSKRGPWLEYYTQAQLDMVYQIYEQDFIKYGYTSARRDQS